MAPEYKDAFRGTAWYYSRFREEYPMEFFNLLKRKFALSKSDRIMDLGCGTGQIAIPVCGFVKEVIAVDPEPEMLAEGKNQAAMQGAQNIVWFDGSSDDLPVFSNTPDKLKLVTMGNSFHWMNREKTLKELHEVIIDSGGIAIVWSKSIWTDMSNNWQPKVKEVISKWLGAERRAGSGIFQTDTERFEQNVMESQFKRMEKWKYHSVVSSTVDSIIGKLYSTSFANPRVLGDKKEAFEKEVREVLLLVSSSGVLLSEGDIEAILAWK